MTIEAQIKAQEKRIIALERALDTLAKEVRAQGAYGKRLLDLEKAMKDLEKSAGDKALEKKIKDANKAAEKAVKDTMDNVRKMNVDVRLANLEKMVSAAMSLAGARR